MNNTASLPIDHTATAKTLYFRGWSIGDIAKELDISYHTVYGWKRAQKWDRASRGARMGHVVEQRYCEIIARENKSEADYKELDRLAAQMERAAKVERFEQTGKPIDLKEKDGRRSPKKRKEKTKNAFSESQVKELERLLWAQAYPHQKIWYDNVNERIRNILKSRQIGATFSIARERLILRAIRNGIDQNFLSASKRQALKFKQDIKSFAELVDVDLVGDDLVLPNGATLRFLGTSPKTAQSYSGDFIFDEYFWVNRFLELSRVAGAMATQTDFNRTYISTPSSVAHEAYAFWTGDWFNKGRREADQVTIDLTQKTMRDGVKFADGQWRQILTIDDVVEMGFDKVDIKLLQQENSPDDFENLYRCKFVDDTSSAFKFSELKPCGVDSYVDWVDIDHLAKRPLGNRAVRVGFDPSRSRDEASVTIVLPGEKARVIERFKMRNMTADDMVAEIKSKVIDRYVIEHFEIDATGLGIVVADLVKKIYPPLKKVHYTPEIKVRMVAKLQSMVKAKRIEFDAGDRELFGALMSIKRAVTGGGTAITYTSSRSDLTGHADAAWSLMHAIGDANQHSPADNRGDKYIASTF